MPWGSCRQTWRREGCPPLPHHLVCVEKFTLPYLPLFRVWRPLFKRAFGEVAAGITGEATGEPRLRVKFRTCDFPVVSYTFICWHRPLRMPDAEMTEDTDGTERVVDREASQLHAA